MTTKVVGRVVETTSTTGTGAYTLNGEATGYRSFADAVTAGDMADGDSVAYYVTDGTDWELVTGVFDVATLTLTRATIARSSNAGAAVNWGAGSKDVVADVPMAALQKLIASQTVYTITDAAGFEIDPANGAIQKVTLGADRTPQCTNLGDGQEVRLMVDDGTLRSLAWTHSTFNSGAGPVWIKNGGAGSAPTLSTTGYTHIVLSNVSGVIYGVHGQP